MIRAFKDLDRVLRGDATHLNALGDGALPTPARRLAFVAAVLAAFYGLCMGCFAVVDGQANGWAQPLASAAKVPALFFLTLAVTLPSLYVFNALVGSRLTATSLVRLLAAAMGVTVALLASFGTIVAFFSFTTTSHSFMVLLNVVAFAASGAMGLTFLLRTLERLTVAGAASATASASAAPGAPRPADVDAPRDELLSADPSAGVPGGTPADWGTTAERAAPAVASRSPAPGALARSGGGVMTPDVKLIFRLWVVLFGVVGAQMSWILRPFIGGGREFKLFRDRGSNFFESVVHHIGNLF